MSGMSLLKVLLEQERSFIKWSLAELECDDRFRNCHRNTHDR